jgi:tetratricopeptide (TPR) repeat protein
MKLRRFVLLWPVLLGACVSLLADDFADAERFYRAGALAEAEAIYARIPPSDGNYAAALLRRGKICYATERPAEAVRLSKACLSIKPSAEAYCLLAGAQFNLEQFDAAYDSAKKAVALDTRYAPGYTTLGMIYTATKDWPDADAAFQESLRLAPADPNTWFMMGRSSFLRDDFVRARESFEKCLRLSPQQVRGYENLALTLDLLGQVKLADETYRRGVKIAQEGQSADPMIHLAYGKFLATNGRSEASLEEFRAAVRLAPERADAHYELANQFARMKEWADAVREGEAAAGLGPPEYRVHYLLARAYTALGNGRAAAQHADGVAGGRVEEPTAAE